MHIHDRLIASRMGCRAHSFLRLDHPLIQVPSKPCPVVSKALERKAPRSRISALNQVYSPLWLHEEDLLPIERQELYSAKPLCSEIFLHQQVAVFPKLQITSRASCHDRVAKIRGADDVRTEPSTSTLYWVIQVKRNPSSVRGSSLHKQHGWICSL